MRGEHVFTHEGRTYTCRLRMAEVGAAERTAIEPNGFWSVTMDGVERKVFDAEPDDLRDERAVQELEQRVIAAMAPYVSE